MQAVALGGEAGAFAFVFLAFAFGRLGRRLLCGGAFRLALSLELFQLSLVFLLALAPPPLVRLCLGGAVVNRTLSASFGKKKKKKKKKKKSRHTYTYTQHHTHTAKTPAITRTSALALRFASSASSSACACSSFSRRYSSTSRFRAAA